MTSSFSQFPLDDLVSASRDLRTLSASLSAPARPVVPGVGVDAAQTVNSAMAAHADTASIFARQLIENIEQFGVAADAIAARASASDITGKSLFNRIQP